MLTIRAIFLSFVLISASAIGFAAARESVVVAIPGNRPLTALADGEVGGVIGAATMIALRELGRDAVAAESAVRAYV